MNFAEVTELGIMSYTIIPSIDRTGRMENHCPLMKHHCCMQRRPQRDHPNLRLANTSKYRYE
jgi:hypothetical protein